MNTFTMIGTVAGNYEIVYDKPLDDKNSQSMKLIKFLLKVPRFISTNESKSIYDYITIKAWNNIFDNIDDTLAFEQILGIKGRVNSFQFKNKEGNIQYLNSIVADKITNLSLL